ncbi:MAG: DUF4129 domain-containing protein, partial [Acidobacteriia bacterium]|nr:DUF4129 domain-containing protein [Terriglobia bacterium]
DSAGSLAGRSGWTLMDLYLDAAASFWREWIIDYDVGHQRTLGKDAATSSRIFFEQVRRWIGRQHRAMLRWARRAHDHFTAFPVRWLGGLISFTTVLIALLNVGRLIGGLRARSLRAHPERAPRQAAALWYDRMVDRMARLGWRKLPSQTPLDFVAAIQETALQEKVARFTRAYESARFGKSVDDAQSLPALFKDVTAQETADPRKIPNRTAAG